MAERELNEDERLFILALGATADEAEAHQLRGRYLSTATSIEADLSLIIENYFRIGHAPDSPPMDQFEVWIMGRLSFMTKYDIAKRLAGAGPVPAVPDASLAALRALLPRIRIVAEYRNRLAHSMVVIGAELGDAKAAQLQHVTPDRHKLPQATPLDMTELREALQEAEQVNIEISEIFWGMVSDG